MARAGVSEERAGHYVAVVLRFLEMENLKETFISAFSPILQSSFVHGVKDLLSSVPCEVEIKLEFIICLFVTSQEAEDVILSFHTLFTACFGFTAH